MSFDKDYPNRKDKRKKFTDSKAVAASCRNHGGCPQCEGNRTFFDKKRRKFVDKDLKDFINSGE